MSGYKTIIAVDTLGGDPYTIGLNGKKVKQPVVERTVQGAINEAKKLQTTSGDSANLELVLIGIGDEIKKELDKTESPVPVHILPAGCYFDSNEPSNSSLYKLIEGIGKDFDGGVTIGDTTQIIQHIRGKLHELAIPNVKQFPLASNIPVRDPAKNVLYLDIGANTACKPEHIYQFAHMARIVLQTEEGIENPLIGLVTVGEEDYKGNRLVKRTLDLCTIGGKHAPNVVRAEPRDVELGKMDAALMDGHTGNIVLKAVEAKAETILGSTKEAIAGIVKDVLTEYQTLIETDQAPAVPEIIKGIQQIPENLMGQLMKQYVFQSLGAASLYGLRAQAEGRNAILKKGHGVSGAKVIGNAISSCRAEVLADLTSIMTEFFAKEYFLPRRN